jgi:hypothetical protein
MPDPSIRDKSEAIVNRVEEKLRFAQPQCGRFELLNVRMTVTER